MIVQPAQREAMCHRRSTGVPQISRLKPTIPARVRWLMWPKMDDKAAKGANADTQEHGKNQDRCARRRKDVQQLRFMNIA